MVQPGLPRHVPAHRHAARRRGAATDLDLHVTGSHTVASTPFLQACDEAFPEPEHLTGDAWVEHALAVCRERGTDVFVPGRERLAVAEAAPQFAALGVRLMVSPPQALRVLGDKALAHASAVALGVPVRRDARGDRRGRLPRRRTRTCAARGLGVCMKPAVDHGAAGFRVLDESVGGYDDLLRLPSPRMHPDDVERRLAERGTVAAAARQRAPRRRRDLRRRPVARRRAARARCRAARAGRSGPGRSSTTRRRWRSPRRWSRATGCATCPTCRSATARGTCRLLEVNTRAASGLFHSAAAGVDLPYAALRLLLDGDVRVPAPAVRRDRAHLDRGARGRAAVSGDREREGTHMSEGAGVAAGPPAAGLAGGRGRRARRRAGARAPAAGEVLVRNAFVSVDPYMRGRMNDAASYAAPYRLGQGDVGRRGRARAGVRRRALPGGRRRAARVRLAHPRGRAGPRPGARRRDRRAADRLPRRPRHARPDGLGRAVRHRRGPAGRDGVGVRGLRRRGQPGRPAGQARRLPRGRAARAGPTRRAALVDTLGLDAGLDHRAGDLEGQLRAAAPQGIDVYFENVGGRAPARRARRAQPVRPDRRLRHDRRLQRPAARARTTCSSSSARS